jgi:hypothetical protein
MIKFELIVTIDRIFSSPEPDFRAIWNDIYNNALLNQISKENGNEPTG